MLIINRANAADATTEGPALSDLIASMARNAAHLSRQLRAAHYPADG
jgi:hypothetical protein